ncbi:PREDICTED: GATA transcription factor 16-like [Ipomoea nil]|uniref:GATA transcription factor 16-like n=1 Tax=Ipomoea nil TaxID=35883 RepID=UPI000901A62F|nr:PREDICTED: GATA transcription factor 16-like [Ipomoea nil]
MADLSDRGSESEEMNNQAQTPDRVSSETSGQIKTCADCGTTKTPLWRGGPAGPKSLCNACGIRSRKKRRALLGLNKDDKKPKKASGNKNTIAAPQNSGTTSDSGSSSGGKIGGVPQPVRRKLVPFGIGKQVALQRPRSQQQRRKIGEVERAAFVLMSLSCGSVYA